MSSSAQKACISDTAILHTQHSEVFCFFLVCFCSTWSSSLARPTDVRAKKKKKKKKEQTRRHRFHQYPPGPRRNAPRWTRPPGSRTPDDFPPFSLLEHGICKADCSLHTHTRKKRRKMCLWQLGSGLMVHRRDTWRHVRLIDITCERDSSRAGLIDKKRARERDALEEGVYVPVARQRGGPSPSAAPPHAPGPPIFSTPIVMPYTFIENGLILRNKTDFL